MPRSSLDLPVAQKAAAKASYLLGVVEIAAALLLLAAPLSARVGVAGGALAALTFATTCSLMLALPIWEPALGFPALGPSGQVLVKDIALLGIALVVLGESAARLAAERAADARREKRPMLLEDKIAVVYGAGGSIGAPTARAFAREGARLHLAGRTRARLAPVAGAIAAAGGSASVAEVDALDEAAVEAHFRTVVAEAGRIDVLFNAIGMEDIQGPPLTEMPFEDFFRPIAKAARSQFLTARAAARHMAARGSGVIMTVTAGPPEAVANIGGFGPACEMIEGLWRGLAAELSPKGVRVISLRSAESPDSADFQTMLAQHAAAGADILRELGSSTLMGRLPSVAEVAEVAALMGSDRASALTGTFVDVTCGSRCD